MGLPPSRMVFTDRSTSSVRVSRNRAAAPASDAEMSLSSVLQFAWFDYRIDGTCEAGGGKPAAGRSALLTFQAECALWVDSVVPVYSFSVGGDWSLLDAGSAGSFLADAGLTEIVLSNPTNGKVLTVEVAPPTDRVTVTSVKLR